ncbi:hypothetical protein SKAU_G00156100 [Synaphobranchus kaupii]|uniref:Uncharacterized protein n=1 Tax=Synaphobranchus kaupii TaxID=118154 RepID=A0A9Q1IZA3_SYNKA|nr:hypothetical protein SKAU_G00156100 [Synaphobranchus kaupii]
MIIPNLALFQRSVAKLPTFTVTQAQNSSSPWGRLQTVRRAVPRTHADSAQLLGALLKPSREGILFRHDAPRFSENSTPLVKVLFSSCRRCQIQSGVSKPLFSHEHVPRDIARGNAPPTFRLPRRAALVSPSSEKRPVPVECPT